LPIPAGLANWPDIDGIGQVADDNLGAPRTQCVGTGVVVVHHGANGVAPVKELIDYLRTDAGDAAAGAGDEVGR